MSPDKPMTRREALKTAALIGVAVSLDMKTLARPMTGSSEKPVQDQAREALLINSLAPKPPMGWNSWNYFAYNVTERDMREMADAIVNKGLRKIGYKYVCVDDCWESIKRDENGRLQSDPVTFPSGMKALADYVHSRGLKFGIYSSAGTMTCAKRAGSEGYEEVDAQTWADWGVDFLKYDACYGTKPFPVNVKIMAQALRKTGRRIVYSITGPVRRPTWSFPLGVNMVRVQSDTNDSWRAIRKAFELTDTYQYTRPNHWPDPDMLVVGMYGHGVVSFGKSGCTTAEYRTQFSLWSIMAAPLIMGADIRQIPEEGLEILKNTEVIAVDQDALGAGTRRVSSMDSDQLQVWKKDLAGGSIAVCLFNLKDTPAEVTATWTDLGLSGPRKVRDLWKRQEMGKQDRQYSATIEPHGVVMIKIAK